jgi:hypothetical protein
VDGLHVPFQGAAVVLEGCRTTLDNASGAFVSGYMGAVRVPCQRLKLEYPACNSPEALDRIAA